MERTASELLKTKLFIPRPRHKTLARPALIDLLNAGLNSALILLSAPAGSGKTTLLVEWLAQIKPPAVWLSLDENDNAVDRFLAYLVSAVQTVWPGFGAAAAAAARSPQPPPAETLLAWLVNELVGGEELVVVLDDYHAIKLETIHAAVNFLIEHLPPQVHLVIATRSDPPLGLSRLRSRLWLTEVRSAQLRFRPAEAAEFLAQVMGLSLSDEADLLRNQLERTQASQVNLLHRRASRWFEQQGLVSEALWHAVRVGDLDRAAELVEGKARDLLLQGYILTIGEWLSALPEDLVRARPWLSLYQAWCLVMTGEAKPVETYLEAVECCLSLEPQERHTLLENVAALRAFTAGKTLDAPKAIEAARTALATIGEENVFLRATAYYNLGVASLMVNDLGSACEALRESGRLGAAARNLNMAVSSLASLGVQEMAIGRLRQAEKTLYEALQLAVGPDGRRLPLAMRPLSALSELHYEWNHLDLARQLAHDGCAQEGGWGNTAAAAQAYLALCEVGLAQGDLSAAQTAWDKADEIIRLYHLPDWHEAGAMRCRVRLWLHPSTGNLAAALRWAEERLGTLKASEPLPYLREAGNIAVARVLVAAGRGEAVLELLGRLQISAQAGGRVGALIQILALQALARSGLGENQSALETLDQALALAEPEEHVRSLIDEGARVAALLVETVARRQTAHLNYAIRLLQAMGFAADPHSHVVQLSAASMVVSAKPVGSSLVEPLTERELEVLGCLAQGMTNTEIAGQLVVAVSTVKRHINHIFAKLSVTSRAQALVTARELGLL